MTYMASSLRITILLAILLLAITVGCITSSSAEISDDDFSPITIPTFATHLRKHLRAEQINEVLRAGECIQAGPQNRTACTFMLGRLMRIELLARKKDRELIDITMVCTSKDVVECLIAYGAAMKMTDPDMLDETRATLIQTMIRGLSVGVSTSVITEKRKYTIQKVGHLWYSISTPSGD